MEINWQSLLMGSEDWHFLPEVMLRSVMMFIIILVALRVLGRRSITQLSVFELGVIIGLGSAAGDPMFYKDVGLLPGLLVFIVIVASSRFLTFLINKSERIEKVLEGEPVYLAEKGKLNFTNFKNELIAQEEFFAQLRQRSVSHLGQVELAIIETNGTVSIFYYEDEDVLWGLPILPHLYEMKSKSITDAGIFACSCCGNLLKATEPSQEKKCMECGNQEWVPAMNRQRVS